MPRPSQNTDRLMIDTAKKIIYKSGISGLKIREISRKSKVNLGMFYYNFGTKDKFIQQVLKEIYDEFFSSFVLETEKDAAPVEKLRQALILLGKFARNNRSLVIAILKDVINGHKSTIEFAKNNFTKHISVMFRLISECQKKGDIVKIPLPQAVIFLAGTIAFPNLVAEVVEKVRTGKLKHMPINIIINKILTDEAIEQRVALAINALSSK